MFKFQFFVVVVVVVVVVVMRSKAFLYINFFILN
uniref:Uncharacterized protein n=1 Tax=Mimivirus LCMiAC01 TaxID=2506608 RepID=A0A481Z063_9VIRU|nr:MAG: hypothetical protein LCMiAC01_04910 [Mimivirus LCMiAC01]